MAKKSKYNRIDSQGEGAVNIGETYDTAEEHEFERLRLEINVNTKNKVSQVFNAAKEGDQVEFYKLVDEIEEKAEEQKNQLYL